MPKYQISAPNGKTYQIVGPPGATQDQVIAEVMRQHPDANTAADVPQNPVINDGTMSVVPAIPSQ